MIKNTETGTSSTTTAPKGGVLGIIEPNTDSVGVADWNLKGYVLNGRVPLPLKDWCKVAILLEDCAAGDTKKCVISGPAIANVKINHEDDQFCCTVDSHADYLQSCQASTGIQILWKATPTGTSGGPIACLVNMGPPGYVQRYHLIGSSTTVPAFGVLSGTTASSLSYPPGQERILSFLIQAANPTANRFFYVNDSFDLVSNKYGFCHLCGEVPFLALYATGLLTPTPGQVWGPIGDSTFKLYPGLPGFKIADTPDTPTTGTVRVIRQSASTHYAKAITKWNNLSGFTAHPCTDGSGSHIYDGTGGYPSITITPTITTLSNGQNPNIQVDDVFEYSYTDDDNSAPRISPKHYDDYVGMVKWWASSIASVPKGWAVMDGTANSGANGGSGYDARGYFLVNIETRTGGSIPAHSDSAYVLGATGGQKSIAQTPFNISGSGTQVDTQTENRPPWMALVLIERIP